jgi:hypothetical protein
MQLLICIVGEIKGGEIYMTADHLGHVPEDVKRRARIEDRMRRFTETAENPNSEVAQMLKVGLSRDIADPNLLRELSVISAFVYEGVPVVQDELGWREARLDDLDFPAMAREFGLQQDRLEQVAQFMVSVKALRTKETSPRQPTSGSTKVVSFFPGK